MVLLLTCIITRTAHSEALIVRGTGYDVGAVAHQPPRGELRVRVLRGHVVLGRGGGLSCRDQHKRSSELALSPGAWRRACAGRGRSASSGGPPWRSPRRRLYRRGRQSHYTSRALNRPVGAGQPGAVLCASGARWRGRRCPRSSHVRRSYGESLQGRELTPRNGAAALVWRRQGRRTAAAPCSTGRSRRRPRVRSHCHFRIEAPNMLVDLV